MQRPESVHVSFDQIWVTIFYKGPHQQVLFEDLESMRRHGSNLTKVDRNALERERRKYMKDLFSKLSFLIPAPHPKQSSLPNLLDLATAYIKQLKRRLELLKQRKKPAEGHTDKTDDLVNGGSGSPMITLCDLDSILQVCLTCGLTEKFTLYQVIDVLVEEGIQVVALNHSIIDDRIFYTIHAQAISSRIGIETSRVEERLKELISPASC